MVKLVGFRDRYDAQSLVAKFRGIISSRVKDCISRIMINGKLSYFIMNANLLEVSNVVKERLDEIFADYGIRIEFFNIESIEVPEQDYAAVSEAKNRRTGRIIEGYTWQEERQMLIAEKFAANEGSVGAVGGMMGGAMGGIMMGGTISEIARGALSPERVPTEAPPKDVSEVTAETAPPARSVTFSTVRTVPHRPMRRVPAVLPRLRWRRPMSRPIPRARAAEDSARNAATQSRPTPSSARNAERDSSECARAAARRSRARPNSALSAERSFNRRKGCTDRE